MTDERTALPDPEADEDTADEGAASEDTNEVAISAESGVDAQADTPSGTWQWDGEEKTPSQPESPRTFLGQLRLWFWSTPTERDAENRRRMAEFDRMIEIYPDSPANYVLRGELQLKSRHIAPAMSDFQKAIELAEQQIHQSDWGVVAQAVYDRAQRGLEKTMRWQGLTIASQNNTASDASE